MSRRATRWARAVTAASLLPGLVRAEDAPEVVVTVSGDARAPTELPQDPSVAASRVGRERVATPGAAAADVLRREVGVQATESGGLGAPATASIRGATAAQTPVYLGGVRLNDDVGGAADLSTIPLWLVDHVDVFRGNAPLEADELGIGGAIFFEPRRPRVTEAGFGATLGSFGTRAGYAYGAGGTARYRLLGGVSTVRADNDYAFHDDRGTLFDPSDDSERRRTNADSRYYDAWLIGRAAPSASATVDVLANTVWREQGAPKLALVPSERARAELSRSLLAVTARLTPGDGRHSLQLTTSLLTSETRLLDPDRELGLLSERTDVAGKRVEQRALWSAPWGARLRLAAGLDVASEGISRSDGGRESSARSLSARALTKVELALSDSSWLRGVAAAECRALRSGEAGCDTLEPTGRVGVGVRLAFGSAYANVSRYARDPTLGELYGAGIVVRGNDSLVPEIGVSADAGVRAVTPRRAPLSVSGELGVFARRAEELIAYARTAQGYVVPINVGRARVLGAELSGAASYRERLGGSFALTLLDGRDTTPGRRLDNDVLPFQSRLVFAPSVFVGTGPTDLTWLSRATLSADWLYYSSRFADPAGLLVIPEQGSVGITATLGWLAETLTTRARLSNALDSARFDVVGYPLPGRSFFASAELILK